MKEVIQHIAVRIHPRRRPEAGVLTIVNGHGDGRPQRGAVVAAVCLLFAPSRSSTAHVRPPAESRSRSWRGRGDGQWAMGAIDLHWAWRRSRYRCHATAGHIAPETSKAYPAPQPAPSPRTPAPRAKLAKATRPRASLSPAPPHVTRWRFSCDGPCSLLPFSSTDIPPALLIFHPVRWESVTPGRLCSHE